MDSPLPCYWRICIRSYLGWGAAMTFLVFKGFGGGVAQPQKRTFWMVNSPFRTSVVQTRSRILGIRRNICSVLSTWNCHEVSFNVIPKFGDYIYNIYIYIHGWFYLHRHFHWFPKRMTFSLSQIAPFCLPCCTGRPRRTDSPASCPSSRSAPWLAGKSMEYPSFSSWLLPSGKLT